MLHAVIVTMACVPLRARAHVGHDHALPPIATGIGLFNAGFRLASPPKQLPILASRQTPAARGRERHAQSVL